MEFVLDRGQILPHQNVGKITDEKTRKQAHEFDCHPSRRCQRRRKKSFTTRLGYFLFPSYKYMGIYFIYVK